MCLSRKDTSIFYMHSYTVNYVDPSLGVISAHIDLVHQTDNFLYISSCNFTVMQQREDADTGYFV